MNKAASAISSIRASRPMGIRELIIGSKFGMPAIACCTIGVSTQVGQRQFTRMPWATLSRAKLFVHMLVSLTSGKWVGSLGAGTWDGASTPCSTDLHSY